MSIFGWIVASLCAVILGLLALLGIEHLRVVAADNRADRAELAVKQAQSDAAALKLALTAQAQTDGAKAQKERDDEAARFMALQGRKVGGTCVADLDAVRLLGDIARAANTAGNAGLDQPAGAPVPESAGAEGAKR